jgi:hypothetical protein
MKRMQKKAGERPGFKESAAGSPAFEVFPPVCPPLLRPSSTSPVSSSDCPFSKSQLKLTRQCAGRLNAGLVASRHPAPKTMLASLSQPSKQELEIVSIDEGIKIDSSAKQTANARSPRCATLESGSNLKFERCVQLLKHSSPIVSIDEGRQIDSSAEQGECPITEMCNPGTRFKRQIRERTAVSETAVGYCLNRGRDAK